jgi:hypothetical protein
MRPVEWTELFALAPGKRRTAGTVTELLTGGPYPSLSPPEVPPLTVVNEMLAKPGGGGMNGGREWRPFALSADDYTELVADLVSSHGYTVADVPAWVATGGDWHVWIMERRWGVPSEPQRLLNQRARDLKQQLEEAKADPVTPAGRLAALYLQATRADEDAEQFAAPWITVPRFSKHRRVMRWLADARRRQRAAEMAGDPAGAAAAAAEADVVGKRSAVVPDDKWPREWDSDWPDYPPEEQKPPRPAKG